MCEVEECPEELGLDILISQDGALMTQEETTTDPVQSPTERESQH